MRASLEHEHRLHAFIGAHKVKVVCVDRKLIGINGALTKLKVAPRVIDKEATPLVAHDGDPVRTTLAVPVNLIYQHDDNMTFV